MNEILDYSMRMHIFPFTLGMGFVVIYWLFVIVGAADTSSLDIDFDVDLDADLDGDIDAAHHGSFLKAVVDFFNLSEVPFMIFMSFLMVFGWSAMMFLEPIFNESGYRLIGFVMWIPALLASSLISKYCAAPFGKIFNLINNNPEDQDKAVGNMGVLLQDTNHKHGRLSIETKSAPIEILCYTDGEELKKGEQALVLSWNDKRRKYLVTKYN